MGELGEDAFSSGTGSTWERTGDEDGLPWVERKDTHGYHRAFRQVNKGIGGRREWLYMKKGSDGAWVPAHSGAYHELGAVHKDASGRFVATVYVGREKTPTEVVLDPIED